MTSALIVLAIVAAFVHGHFSGRRQKRADWLDHFARPAEGGS